MSRPNLGYCIGGEHCFEVRLYMKVREEARQPGHRVRPRRHGRQTNAVLGLFADGVQIGGRQDVRKDGSTHTYYPNRPVAELHFRSQSTDGKSEETVINSIIVR